MRDYSNQLADLTAAEPALGGSIAHLRNLEGILRWLPDVGIPLSGIDLTQQDEYSYDLLLPLPDTRWLVFGVT